MEYNVPTKVGTEFSLRKIPSPQGRHTLIIIVAMKLIALLFLFNLQVTASVYSQRISLTASNTPLRDVLQSVRKQSGYSFFVESDNLRDSKPVNLNLMDNSVPEALDKIFENQPFTYTIQNNVIVVTRKERSNLSGADFLTFDSGAPDSTKVVYVQGSVRDDKGQPLVGVSVRVKGGGTGTVTKPDGTYTLKTNAAATLIFSYIGYLSREIKAQQGEIDVVLKQLNTALDQVQVIAYGTTTKRTSTGNIGTVSAEVIERQPVSNPLLTLQGRVPGVFIQQTTGVAAGNINVNIQGVNSLAQGTSPFFVIDGVPYPPVNPNPSIMTAAIGGSGGSTLNYVNPGDIESITVLKDADATAIYGSRAANGAILITTKKGKPGNTRVDVDFQTGFSKVSRQPKLLNTTDYIRLRKEAKKNDNSTISYTNDYDISGAWDSTKTTNWQKMLVGGSAQFTNAQAAISGGTEHTQFYVGGGYLKQTTVTPGDFADTRENVHMSFNHKSNNQKFRMSFSGTYVNDDNSMMNIDLMSKVVTLPPNAPQLYKEDGTLSWGLIPGTSRYTLDNPIAYITRRYKGATNNTIGNIELGYMALPGLEISSSAGYNNLQIAESAITPQSSFSPALPINLRKVNLSNKSTASWIIEPKIKYKKDFNNGKLDILIGSSFQQKKDNALLTAGGGFIDDAQLENIANAPNITAQPYIVTYRYNGFYSRINYNHRDKYLITLAGRRDGTTRFGSANRFANFYSVAGAWIFSDERFSKNSLPWLSLGKLKISYGTTGNDQIPDYLYLSLYNNITTPILYQQTVGIQPTGLSNPYLQWELTKKLNLGIDVGVLNNQILFSANYNINRSSNQLITYPLGLVTGFIGVNQNIDATIQNTGFEFQLDVSPLKSKKVIWNISANLTIPTNKLIEFKDLDKTTFRLTYEVGQPVNIAKVFPFLGVNPNTGLYQYRAADGKATSIPNSITDRTEIINTSPKYYGSISNTISFKGLTLDFLFQFVKKMGATNRMTLTGFPGVITQMPTAIQDRWRRPGDVATYQMVSSENFDAVMAYYALGSSSANYEDASFIKLRNLRLSYTCPHSWAKKIKINTARFFIQGQNLLTISNFFGTDPETAFLSVLPPLRTITFGLHLNI
ncbi:TonB-linked outer membrane protein, SusC/RagA family [Chitinophaga eiseniae]|uniref:TonB-linked outer membrane protein, SusC/RagA family n=1 Tax=Chitinophaga eiseniae TaxID=634771 RepID=A0A1T4N499_9BACT|nr:SusC/RagA family TonB-linked outer membrane protein [Chitinophaga eiseniae]SJZ74190.1 TonB-linked outer membrane protein, SusC/RagA family [Chitinophaga eiseniae]